ncbi:hypothetical protein EU811_20965 [Arthrobacter sp. TS-15]|uniref:hypothetical protein n=1 Tax=Arthrobacter sp. TS-15 TaxID=2510797 RepID=UPI00115ED1CF|nr:hypothetical protein [Arthrobacter sp. TS-15]TQS88617.1 hypothetical protein EU811_20965 [Arthrobacter sp. TS-15]
MNHERDDEDAARKIVESVRGIQLEHADVNGEVDYLSNDRSVALEVTRVTEKEKKDTRRTFEKSATDGSEARLQTCWTVTVSEVHRPAKDIVQRVQPLVAELESAGLTSFYEQDARNHVDDNGEFSHIYSQLLKAGVAEALPLEERPDCPEHAHSVRISPWGGGPVGDSNSSLAKLIEELEKPKMRKKAEKLWRSGATERHLFVWLDDDTAGSISRPLSHEPPSRADEEWGTPTDRPPLDSAITHLWIMHERSGMGWRWDGETWWGLHEPQADALLNEPCDGTS